jgi:hypothetical protein
MPTRRDMIWFAKALATATFALALCAVISRRDPTLPLPASSGVGGNFEQALDRYAKDPEAQIVLAGSSVTVRLREEFFSRPGLRNLAIGGGSALTGLEIAASYPKLPPLILVEANVLSRGINSELVQKYSRNSAATRPLLARPVRLAGAHYQAWLSRPPTADQEHARISALLQQPPAEHANAATVARQIETDNSNAFPEESRNHAAELSALVASLEDRGSRVYLYQLPYQRELNDTKYAQVARAVMRQTFPQPERWLDLDYPLEQLRWADGIHLDERSAALVAQSMDRAIDRLARNNP